MMVVFEKGKTLRYIGHLDLMRAMQRALRRADLPVRYSQGYNPHVNLAFATALSVGAQSRCELMDVELEEAVAPEAFAQRLNACLPEGLKIRRARLADDHAPALTARMAEAGYEVRVPGLDLRAKVEAFLASGEVIVEKRSKKGVKPVNIRPMVHALACEWDGENSKLTMILEQTNANSLKAELLLQALGAGERYACLRTGLYGQGARGERVELFEAAKE